jgi:V8-like Glu-specific endopeptidase
MASILYASPFPFANREAQQLHLALCELYPTASGAMFIAQRAGLEPWRLNAAQAAYLLWDQILDTGATAQLNREIVKLARDQNPRNPRRPFFDKLLAEEPIDTLDAEPRGLSGAPSFLIDNDNVTEEEALLFHDDLTLQIGRVPWLITVLQRLLTVAPAVCLLQVRTATASGTGTGFRIANDLILTNWHVLHIKNVVAATVSAEFGFDDDGKGGGLASTAYACDIASIRGKPDDDWAVIQVTSPLPNSIITLKLSEAAEPVMDAPAFVVQHPAGQRKRLAYVRNQITTIDPRVVQYLSDTQPGSSGAPVLDENGRLVALHHAGGRPQEVAGKTPIRKNEGIRISRVLEGFQQMNIPVV